eukprot:TRINITY_DN1385_c0_g1_i1.p1 TRINITY_DN1385_c0_g1~~TRINITY_DN1385_c0_g1_i1.p1  ORF type:complete len:481 (-),score=121.80 TRINITY_DN1385_c0_g1_i1:474-1916(-)
MASFTNEFWKEIPDHVLEELYQNLGQGDGLEMSVEDTAEMHDPPPPSFSSTAALPHSAAPLAGAASTPDHPLLRNSGFFGSQSGDAPEGAGGGGGGRRLPPLFQTQSLTNVDSLPAVSSFASEPREVRPEMEQVRGTLEQLIQMEAQQEQQLERLRQMQHHVLGQGAGGAGEVEGVQEQLWAANEQVELELKELHGMHCSVVLDSPELHEARLLGQRLHVQQVRLEVLRRELHHFASGDRSLPCFAMLALQEQPIPQVMFKGKTIDDTYTLLLVCGARDDIVSLSRVKAVLISEETTLKKSKAPLSNDEENVDVFQRRATFQSLKVNVSTRMSMVHLKFQVQVQQESGSSGSIESVASYPIIVITNESQWCEAEGKIVLSDIFASEGEVPWPQFANALHHHFLKATRQDPAAPLRSLRLCEFEYIHTRIFDASPTIDQEQASRFWQWFGPVTQTIRFKRHVNNLWYQGYVASCLCLAMKS